MKPRWEVPLWLAFYGVLILAPLVVLLIAPGPPGREFLRELSVALGFAGLALMGLQFIPTGRLPMLAGVLPTDTVYSLHHRLSIVGLFLALLHPVLLFLNNPYTLRLLDILAAPWRARAAVVAILAGLGLVVTSVYRKRLALKYEAWRLTHDLLTFALVGLALYHMFRVNYRLSVPAQRTLWIAYAALWVGVVLYARVVRPWRMLRRPYEVTEVIPEGGQSYTLRLAPVGHQGIRFHPGQMAWLTLKSSPFWIQEHPFSFASSAEQTATIDFAIKELGDMTSQIHDLPPGHRVYIDGPFGTFSIDRYPAPGYVFLAGGIGITPIMSMLRTLADRGDKRPLLLLYGNYSEESIVFRQELDELQARLNLRVVHVLERPSEEWRGEKGFITQEMLTKYLPSDRKERIYWVCGPLPMIYAMEHHLLQLGVPLEAILAERYEMA